MFKKLFILVSLLFVILYTTSLFLKHKTSHKKVFLFTKKDKKQIKNIQITKNNFKDRMWIK